MPILTNSRLVKLPSGASQVGNGSVPINMRLKAGEIVGIDVSASMDRIESLYFDATQASTSFQIDFGDTGRSLVIPPGSESCNRSFSAQPYFTVTNLDPGNPVVLSGIAFACNQPVYERFPGSGLLRFGGVAQPIGTLTQTTAYTNPGPWIPVLGPTWAAAAALAVQPNSVYIGNNGLDAQVLSPGGPEYPVPFSSALSGGRWYVELQDVGTLMGNSAQYPLQFVTIGAPAGVMNNPAYIPSTGFQRYSFITNTHLDFIMFNGNVMRNGAQVAGANFGSIPNKNNRVCLAIDITNNLAWVKPDITLPWNGSTANNPSTGVGGYDISFIPRPLSVFIYGSAGTAVGPYRLIGGPGTLPVTGPVPAGFAPGWPAVTPSA